MGKCPIQSCIVRWCKRKRKNGNKYDWSAMLGQEVTRSTIRPAAATVAEEEEEGGGGDGTYQAGKGKSERAEVVRVKMVLTKAEVARLLAVGVSATEDAVVKHLATALQRLENPREGCRPGGPWRPVLESIPEIV